MLCGHGDGTNRTKKQCSWWCAACGGQHEWRAPTRILVVQIGVDADRAKVFTAHTAPMGLCDTLINALKLLAKQQKDGDNPRQSILTGLHERSRRGSLDGLGCFTRADNRSAVDVGHLREGTRPLHVQKKPNVSEAHPEAAIRDGADEVKLRADELETLRAFISTDHIKFERWGPPLTDADWHALCQAIYKGIEGQEWEELYCHYREMSKATGAKKAM